MGGIRTDFMAGWSLQILCLAKLKGYIFFFYAEEMILFFSLLFFGPFYVTICQTPSKKKVPQMGSRCRKHS